MKISYDNNCAISYEKNSRVRCFFMQVGLRQYNYFFVCLINVCSYVKTFYHLTNGWVNLSEFITHRVRIKNSGSLCIETNSEDEVSELFEDQSDANRAVTGVRKAGCNPWSMYCQQQQLAKMRRPENAATCYSILKSLNPIELPCTRFTIILFIDCYVYGFLYNICLPQ